MSVNPSIDPNHVDEETGASARILDLLGNPNQENEFWADIFSFKENFLVHDHSKRDLNQEVVNQDEEQGTSIHKLRRDKKKKEVEANSESSEFDDSSDENYKGEEDSEDTVESDAPSEAFEDIEGCNEDDIFIEQTACKDDLMKKLKSILRRQRRKVDRNPKENLHEVTANEDWYTDLDDDEDIDRRPGLDDVSMRQPQFIDGENMKNFEMKPCLKFANVNVYRKAFRDWSVRKGYEFEFVKNERLRVTAICAHEGCKYRIHASVVQGGPCFMVKTMTGEHTCTKPRKNKHATSRYLGQRIENAIRDNSDVPIEKLKKSIMRKCGVEVSYWKALRAKKAAFDRIKGMEDIEYSQLWDYCETLRSRNVGSKLILRKVSDSEPPIFDRIYFSLAAMRLGFISGCRPFIGLDGCFLKTPYGGQLLCAIGRDGNDNLFPIALAVVSIECRETWTWFISELLEDIGGVGADKLVFISDRQKGLVDALRVLAPNSEHRFCVRHMYQNFKQKWTNLELKELFWKAASTANKSEFDSYMKEIQKKDPKVQARIETAFEWLSMIPPCHWSRSHFKTECKTDVLVNNLCESFNNFILDAREMPIISMFEWIRNRLTGRMAVKRERIEKFEGTICPNILKKINKSAELGRSCFQTWCGKDEFEVEHRGRGRYVVDLAQKECSCGMFQLSGYPCPHAWVSIADRRHKMDDYVHPSLKKEMYSKVYEHMLHGVPGPRDYIKTNYIPMLPPRYTRKPGRPKKMRRKGKDEVHNNSYRRGLTHKCTNCLQLGHNRATCTNLRHSNSKWQQKRKV